MSTGLECEIVGRRKGEWYYILEDYDAPKMAWDWREHATCYGPFKTEEDAIQNLGDNHANPGGWTTWAMGAGDEDESYTKLFRDAVIPKPHTIYGIGYRRMWQ